MSIVPCFRWNGFLFFGYMPAVKDYIPLYLLSSTYLRGSCLFCWFGNFFCSEEGIFFIGWRFIKIEIQNLKVWTNMIWLSSMIFSNEMRVGILNFYSKKEKSLPLLLVPGHFGSFHIWVLFFIFRVLEMRTLLVVSKMSQI